MSNADLINLISALADHIAAEDTDQYTKKGMKSRELLLGQAYKTLSELHDMAAQ